MIFSQRDPMWATERLGTGLYTIEQVGCLVSAVASGLTDLGIQTDPHRLNRWLISNHGYYDNDLLIFSALEGLGVKLVEVILCHNEPAPISCLSQAIDEGDFVVALVDYEPGGAVEQHWVRLLRVNETAGQVGDPWRLPGAGLVDLSVYLAAGWHPARGIFAAVIYRLAEGRRFPVTARNGPTQAARCIRG
jgi:hypothetical protein